VYPLYIIEATGSIALAGLVGAARTAPYVLASLHAGVLVDRIHRKTVLVACDVLRAVVILALIIAIAFSRSAPTMALIVAAVLEGTLFVYFNVAEASCIARIVPKSKLASASALNEGGGAAAALLGPIVGAVLFKYYGVIAPLCLDAASYILSALCLAVIKTPLNGAREESSVGVVADLFTGLKWIWGRSEILFFAMVTAILNLLVSMVPLVQISLLQHRATDTTTIGFVLGLCSVGGLLGSAVAGIFNRRIGLRLLAVSSCGTLALAFSVLIFPVDSTAFVLASGLVIGSIAPIYNVGQYTYRISIIPDALQGRVNSSFRLIAFALIPIGSFLAGDLTERLGPIATVLAMLFASTMLTICCIVSSSLRAIPARPTT
jgi:MFS family permease